MIWARPREGHAKPEGNATDLRYLEHAVAALGPIIAICADSARSSSPNVQALAREALSVQCELFDAISALLCDWGRSETTSRPVGGAEPLVALDGQALDQRFVDRLAAHARASIRSSRAELIAGASRSTRHLAEHAIHVGDRQLAAIRDLPLGVAHPDGAPGGHGSMARWSDDGGSWQTPSSVTPLSATGG